MSVKVIARNRKASFDFELLDTFEAGIVLFGSEIKAIRASQISIKEAYVRTNGREAWLVNSHIAPYHPASRDNHESTRERKLLLHGREIDTLWDSVKRKGLTIVPLRVYLKDGLAKIEIAVARGKQKYDKRQAIKERDIKREMRRALREK
jgi:SsrA-binding protein